MSATDLLDMRRFAAELRERRNKAALVLAPRLPEQRAYAARLAEALGVPHLDLLDRFCADPDLAAGLAVFSPDELLAFIRDEAAGSGAPLLVVSGIEFLLGAWLAQHDPKPFKEELCRQIETWESSPAFLLVVHHDPVFAAYRPQRFSGSRVVAKLSETLALT